MDILPEKIHNLCNTLDNKHSNYYVKMIHICPQVLHNTYADDT